MFEASLVESSAVLRTGNRWPAIISTAFYAAIALALVTLPILRPEVLNTVVHPLITFMPPRPATPPPPVHVTPSTASSASASMPAAPILNTRPTIPSAAPVAAPNFDATATMTGPSTSIIGLGTPSAPSISVAKATSGTAQTSAGNHTRLNISTGLSQGLLLTELHPLYPPIAKAAHQEGTVTVQAIISRTGQIESAHVTSGPSMLQASALDAVRSARYRPYLLNGQPTEVDTIFSIIFRLGSSE